MYPDCLRVKGYPLYMLAFKTCSCANVCAMNALEKLEIINLKVTIA